MYRRSGVGLACGLVLAFSLTGSVPAQSPDGFIGSLRIVSDDPLFGGLSAIEVSSDGAGLLAVLDRGAYVVGRMIRDAQGKLTEVRLGPMAPLKGPGRKPLTHGMTDSEGVAVADDGSVYVSFEGKPRVVRYDHIGGGARPLPDNPAFADLPSNGALEAIAVDADGTVYTVPESPPGDRLPVYPFRDGAWQPPFSLPRSDDFSPVAADFGPDGRFYLLERRFHGYRGFSSRLRRFSLAADGFAGEEVLMQSPPGLHDNLEGMAIWRAADGLRATMVSDDNFFPFQVTEIVEYRLPD